MPLKLNLAKGKNYFLRHETIYNIVSGGEVEASSYMDYYFKFSVYDIEKNGNLILDISCDSIKFNQNPGNNDVYLSYNSTKSGNLESNQTVNQELSEMFSTELKITYRLILKSNGEAVENSIVDWDEDLDTLLLTRQYHLPVENARNSVMKSFAKAFSFYPIEGIAENSYWEKSDLINEKPVNMQLNSTYTLENKNKDTLIISIGGSGEGYSVENSNYWSKLFMKGNQSGELKVIESSGLPVASTTNVLLKITGNQVSEDMETRMIIKTECREL